MVNLNNRERKIIDLLVHEDHLSMAEISDRLNVSRVTIRSDFAGLTEKGLLVKTRGGVLPAFHPEILEKQKSQVDVKKRLARAGADLVEDGDSIMIVAGTTMALIGKYLLGKSNIKIVTNSTLLLPYVRINPSIQLTIVGGEFRPQAEAMVGPQSLVQLDQYHVKTAFIGTEGFSLESGMTTQLVENAETIRKMVTLADRVVLLADSAKYNTVGFVKILPLEAADLIITDSKLPVDVQEALLEKGHQLKIV
ncbi:MAG: DeoR/GlpR transcriptional regulator [Spirochaetales bacterium]|nr:DeoR/GlpR transcriptional regulator [Spirochaetales bacterium]